MCRIDTLNDDLGPVLAQLMSLSHLKVRSCAHISGKFLDALKAPSSLVMLDLRNCKNVQDTRLRGLSRLTALQSLTLDGIKVRSPTIRCSRTWLGCVINVESVKPL